MRPTTVQQDRTELGELLIRIAQTPAPTFAEGARAELVAELWREAGLTVEQDAVGNLVAQLPANGFSSTTDARPIIVAAHLDSVFGPEVDVSVKRGKDKWSGPGIGDNAASLAVLSHYLRTRAARAKRPALIVAATVGEEGLGDVRGARELVRVYGSQARAFIAFDGTLGSVADQAVGSERFEVSFQAAGGHSWGDYGSPSAIHAMGEAIAALRRLHVPAAPRSSLNVGQVWGGTSINAIAETARFNLDLRSVDAGTLAALTTGARSAIESAAAAAKATVSIKQVGSRPAGSCSNDELVAAAKAAYADVGIKTETAAASTDANPAMAAGLPAISFGAYHGGDAHRLEEWLDPNSLELGLAALTGLLARLA